MSEVLVLNAAFLPVEVISARDAIISLYQNKSFTVVESDKVMRSPSITFKVPHVISLLKHKKIPKRKVGYSSLKVLYRDDLTCQYCGKKFKVNDLTIDHIIPKSRWKEVKRTSKRNWTTWLNCVCACKWCNNKKGNDLLNETNMKLIRKPYVPTYMPHITVSYENAKTRGWLPFSNWNIRLIDRPSN